MSLIQKIKLIGMFVLLAVSYINPVYADINYKPGELLVRFRTSASDDELLREAGRINSQATTFSALKAEVLKGASAFTSESNHVLGYEKIIFSNDQDVMDKSNKLKKSGLVEWAEPNYRRKTFAVIPGGPDDPYYNLPQPVYGGNVRAWWFDQVKADRVFAENLVNTNNQIIIAILDSGVRMTHEDLSSKIVNGYDFVSNNNDPTDDNGHGTHVAGIAAAVTNNNTGIPGIGFMGNIKIMPVKVGDRYGYMYDADICRGIQWAADNGARVINMSFGGPIFSHTIQSAINYAHKSGCVLVAAAGNYAESEWQGFFINPVMYPASCKHVISVAATNSVNARSAYSEFNQHVDIAAPGGQNIHNDPWGMIVSTYFNSDNNYTALYGTSMASPVVAGAAALLLAQDSSRTPDQVESLLIATADKTDTLVNDIDGYNEYLGYGQINIYSALKKSSSFKADSGEKATYNYPNPFDPWRDGWTSVLIPENGSQAVLIVVNSFGHKVYSQEFSGEEVFAGQVMVWDGKDEQGVLVANGVYPYVLKVDGKIFKNKIVVKQ